MWTFAIILGLQLNLATGLYDWQIERTEKMAASQCSHVAFANKERWSQQVVRGYAGLKQVKCLNGGTVSDYLQ